MFFKSKAMLTKLKQILGFEGGGVQKRIDENRELLELLSNKAPGFMVSRPAVVGWLKSNDEFFCALAGQLPVERERFSAIPLNQPGGPFPRPWPNGSHAPDVAVDHGESVEIVLDRSQFEAYWLTRGIKSEKSMLKSLEKDSNNDYCDDSTQRHWWTWQNALKYSTLKN